MQSDAVHVETDAGLDPFDPIENIEGGSSTSRELLVTLRGNLTNRVAAYNAGPLR